MPLCFSASSKLEKRVLLRFFKLCRSDPINDLQKKAYHCVKQAKRVIADKKQNGML